jgi:hypothetical protein
LLPRLSASKTGCSVALIQPLLRRKLLKLRLLSLKAQLEANPDQKLTEEEVRKAAEAIANKKVADQADARICKLTLIRLVIHLAKAAD